MTPHSAPHSTGLALDRTKLGRLGLVLAVFGLLLCPIALLASKAMVILVLTAAIAGGLAAGTAALPWRVIDRKLAAGTALLLAWCFLAALWSPHPAAAAGLALRIALLSAALLYLAGLARLLDGGQRVHVARAVAVGFGITLALLAIDLSFRTPVFDLLYGFVESDYTTYSRLNRGVSAVAILVWPVAVYAWHRGWRPLAVALPLAVLGLTLFSESSSTMLALGFGVVAAMLCGLGRNASRLVMATAIVAALFGSFFAVDVMRGSGLAEAEGLPETGRYRLHVWTIVTERIAERPWVGWGFDASPDLPARDALPFRDGASVIPSHPHNGALQILVELGLVGSLLTAGWLFLIAARIDSLTPLARAGAVAMMVTILLVACAAYGIWQSHWLAVIGSAAAIFAALPPPEPSR